MKPQEVTIVYILSLPFVLCPLPFAIEAIGDDFYWDESVGCEKGGQSGLAVV